MSPRSAEANEAIHAERRMSILNSALEEFVERGFEGTRIQELSKRSSMSYGLIYHYFPSKEAVFAALVEMALEAAGSLIQALVPASPADAFGTLVRYALSDPSPRYFALIVEALTKKGVAPELTARVRETVLGFKATIAAAIAGEGAMLAGEDARAEGILAILLGASTMKICGMSDGAFAYRSAAAIAASIAAPGKE